MTKNWSKNKWRHWLMRTTEKYIFIIIQKFKIQHVRGFFLFTFFFLNRQINRDQAGRTPPQLAHNHGWRQKPIDEKCGQKNHRATTVPLILLTFFLFTPSRTHKTPVLFSKTLNWLKISKTTTTIQAKSASQRGCSACHPYSTTAPCGVFQRDAGTATVGRVVRTQESYALFSPCPPILAWYCWGV